MPAITCEYCGCNLWTTQDQNSHPVPCRPGVAPGSTTVGVPPGETLAPEAVVLPSGTTSLAADTAAQGLVTEGSPL